MTLLDVYQQVCTHDPPLIAVSRYKDVMTALKYLANTYGTTLDKLPFTPAVEADYRQRLRTYFDVHPKGHSTVRNTLNYLSKLWKALHQIDQAPPVPPLPRTVPGYEAVRERFFEQSPYRHSGWLGRHGYAIPPEQWPAEMVAHLQTYRHSRILDVRSKTMQIQMKNFSLYVSYQLMSPDERMARLPEPAQTKLKTESCTGWLREIVINPRVTLWDELFEVARLNSYITWSSWRVWRWQDDILKTKEPHRPSTQGWHVAQIVKLIANYTKHPRYEEIRALFAKLQHPMPMHDKKAPMHRFELPELEEVALALMAEARRIQIDPRAEYPGTRQAVRFQLGLMLQLAWRNPMRARNWCEAIFGHNLKQEEGTWRWHFKGSEMKIGMRGTVPNIFEPDVPSEVAVHLEEFFAHYRPRFPNAASDQHVFLSQHGTPLEEGNLLNMLKIHVNRYTGKRLYPHLLRSLFSTHHLSHGMDINSVAYAMNDTPQSVLKAYNELMADTHRPIIAEANQRALASGRKPLTPPVIPITPKAPKPMKINPDQMNLI